MLVSFFVILVAPGALKTVTKAVIAVIRFGGPAGDGEASEVNGREGGSSALTSLFPVGSSSCAISVAGSCCESRDSQVLLPLGVASAFHLDTLSPFLDFLPY